MNAVKLLVTTSSVYFLACGPYVLAVLLTSFIDGFHVHGRVRFFFLWLANSNSFMNVITFSVVYRAFRHKMKRLLLDCLCYLTCAKRFRMSCQNRFMDNRSEYTSDAASETQVMRQANELSTSSARNEITIDIPDD